MSNNKEKFSDFENPMDALSMLTKIMSNSTFGSYFGGIPFEEKEKNPYEQLGNGYELRPIEILAEGGQFVVDNLDKYSHLYHNGLKVSDKIFRKGGICIGFKDGYCNLIHYTQKTKHTEKRHGFDFGTHVIINSIGEIVMSPLMMNVSGLDYPNYIGGHLGSIGNYIYDLRNGKAIAPKSSTSIKGMNCIIVEHIYDYDWYDKEVKLPLGIYRIDFTTCELTLIDSVK